MSRLIDADELKNKMAALVCDGVNLNWSFADVIDRVPSAQPERDIPKKPNETTDRAWGIPNRQAVCPNCDSYLGTIHFICEGDKRKVTYCDSCGQAIDWSEWEWDAERREE